MTQFKKFMTLMIVLLSCYSYSWCQSKADTSYISLTGVVEQDSVLIAISDLRIANAKMIELNYEKEINAQLRGLVQTDSILIDALSTNLSACELNTEQQVNKYKKQRNIAIGAGSGTSLLFLLLFIIAL